MDTTRSSSMIRQARERRGLGVRSFAKRLGVTPGAITQMELSDAEGRIGVGTLRRALRPLGQELVLRSRPIDSGSTSPTPRAPFERREDRVTYELHRAVARHLLENRDEVMSRVPEQVERMRGRARGGANTLLDDWLDLVDAPVGDIINVILGEDEHSKDMRQMSPFIGVLSEGERLQAIDRAAR